MATSTGLAGLPEQVHRRYAPSRPSVFKRSRSQPILPQPRELKHRRSRSLLSNQSPAAVKRYAIRLMLALLAIVATWAWLQPGREIEGDGHTESFAVPAHPIPVYEDPSQINYENTPVSRYRPIGQFVVSPRTAYKRKPVVAVLTVTQNNRPDVLRETYRSLVGQSLQSWRWIIADDHSTQAESLRTLKELAAHDPRIVLLRDEHSYGVADTRNVAITYILKHQIAPYVLPLDDDDFLELTAMEKAFWALESNPQWAILSYWVKFGAQNTTEQRGLHLGDANYYTDNYVANAAMFRADAVGKCRYDSINFSSGGEDWDFWLCIAGNGRWGATIPELLYWYRVNPAVLRESRWGKTFDTEMADLRRRIQDKNQRLVDQGGLLSAEVPKSMAFEPIVWESPVENSVAVKSSRAIMILLPWMYVGGADIGALRMVETFARAGWRVTIVCTLYHPPAGIELRPRFMQWTHDIHFLPAFLRANDFPRFLKYLVDSRGIKTVLMSNSQLGYELLPAWREMNPGVKFIDYLHNEAYDGWKTGGYPSFSLAVRRYLDRTITCSFYLRDWLIERGFDGSRIGVVKLGMDKADFRPPTDAERAAAKSELLGLEAQTPVVVVLARLDHQKRSAIVPNIAARTREILEADGVRGDELPVIVMIGDGELRGAVEERIRQYDLGAGPIRLLGTISNPQAYLKAADVFLLPSVSEGVSVAVSEAMAVGLPVLTAQAGALPEQLGARAVADPSKYGGVLVKHTLVDASDVELYSQELAQLIRDVPRRRALGENALNLTRTSRDFADWRVSLLGLFDQIERAKPVSASAARTMPNPVAHFAIQNLLSEAWIDTDLSSSQQAMRTVKRDGPGLILQTRCGEISTEMTVWIDAIVEPRMCAGYSITEDEHDDFIASAQRQCGSWCIFDLSTNDPVGYAFDGDCFVPFQPPSLCDKFYFQRPATS